MPKYRVIDPVNDTAKTLNAFDLEAAGRHYAHALDPQDERTASAMEQLRVEAVTEEPHPLIRDKFEPKADEPYAVCLVCELKLVDDIAASEHMRTTMERSLEGNGVSARSHGVRITNRSRTQRIGDFIGTALESAEHEVELDFHDQTFTYTEDGLDRIVEKLRSVVIEGSATAEEIEAELKYRTQVLDAWHEAAQTPEIADFLDPTPVIG